MYRGAHIMTKGLIRVIARISAVLVLSALAGVRPGIAAADLSSMVRFDIAPQQLPSALLKYSQQSGVQVTSSGDLIEGKTSAGLVGTFQARGALEQLLMGTELGYVVIDPNTIAIRPIAGHKPSTALSSGEARATGEASNKDDQKAKGPFWDRFRLAQMDQGKAASDTSVEKQDEQASRKTLVQLEEVIVTGSRIPTLAGQGAQDVKIYTREKIEQSGQTTVANFLNTLPDVSIAVTEN